MRMYQLHTNVNHGGSGTVNRIKGFIIKPQSQHYCIISYSINSIPHPLRELPPLRILQHMRRVTAQPRPLALLLALLPPVRLRCLRRVLCPRRELGVDVSGSWGCGLLRTGLGFGGWGLAAGVGGGHFGFWFSVGLGG